jgi:eukaryotic-like serine/threonine-protein kinase
MNCAACGRDNPDDANYCRGCGRALHGEISCLACGSQNPAESSFCNKCGRPLGGASPPAPVGMASPALPEPTAFCDGRYTVKRLLGEGGKKRVYLATDTLLDRDVAFALIKTDGLDDVGRERVRREARAMGRLGAHPHVVSVFDLGEEDGQPFIVTELMGGGDVEGLIEQAEQHRLPLADALRIADEVCQGLEFAHSKNVVHRDLKPGNVWLTAAGTAKLGDFGLAVSLDRTRLTQAGMMVGTVSYMPPEQATGGEVTPRSDLYSLGAMLYELVTGRPPFIGDESVAIITQHLNLPPVAPSWHTPGLPPALEALILRLLEKDPSKRPASAAEVRAALASVQLAIAGSTTLPRPSDLATDRVSAAGDDPLYRRAFVGREAELKLLRGGFDAALSGQGSLAAVVGEPGIGKTALCEQIATYAAVRGGKTIVGHCYEEGSLSLPYLPFIEALRSYVLTRDPEGLKQDLGSGAAEVARIVSEIRDRIPVELQAASIDPDADRWRLYQALAGFLRNASAVQPLLLVLEDLHWADRGTLDLLVYLARQLAGSRLLIVGNYRDVEVDRSHPLSGTLGELRRGSAFLRIPLRGLTADEVQRMMSAIVSQDVTWSLAEAVHRQTEGNPLFVQEVLRYLAEEGLVHRQDGRWQRTGTAPLELQIPEGLRDVIGKRLSRLPAECNRILAIAAVIGRDFELRTLQAVSGLDEEALVAALEEAVRVGVLEDQSRAGILRFRFAHAFFRQTLYEELFSARRLRLHQQVARALEHQFASRLEEHAAELVEHFAQSTDPDDLRKAVRYGELAAHRASSVYAYGEAARLLEQTIQAQEILDPDDRAKRCDLLLELGEALGPAGEPARAAEQVAPEAFALAETLGDQDRASQACELAVDAMHRDRGSSVVMNDEYRAWAERWDGVAAPETRARAYADCVVGSVLRPHGNAVEANARVLRALELARRLGEPEVLFRAAASALFGGLPPSYQEQQQRLAHEFAERSRAGVRISTLVLLLIRVQGHLLAGGDRDGAERIWREIEELGSHTRDVAALLWPLEQDALRAGLDGELGRTVELSQDLISRAEELGIPRAGQDAALQISFQPLLYLGRASEILDAPRYRNVWNARSSPFVHALYGYLLAQMGRRAEARPALSNAIRDIPSLVITESVPTRLCLLALEGAVLVEDAESAAIAREPLRGLAGTVDQGLAPFNVARVLGDAAALLGEREAATQEYRRSLDWATRLRHRPEIALTRFAMAELLLSGLTNEQAEAQAHLDFAIDEFRAMKMQPYLERALRHKGLLHA